ncbi:hypothetical protein QEN19_000953 [Hanseniaspora menglaensis]
MLHLPNENLLIQKTLYEALEKFQQKTPIIIDRIVTDFDFTQYHLSTVTIPGNEAELDESKVLLSYRSKAWASLLKTADSDVSKLSSFILSKLNNKFELFTTEQSYDFTILIDLNTLEMGDIVQLSLIKIHILSYPFIQAISEYESLNAEVLKSEEEGKILTSSKIYHIENRPNHEGFYIIASSDRITVIFNTKFQDYNDQIFGKVFIQEFIDSRKRNRAIQSSPQVLFSTMPPLEISKSVTKTNEDDHFITFVLFPRHFSNKEIEFLSIAKILQFRNYFHYHIKCSKAYLHSRMRYRVGTFLKVLNRAKIEEESESGVKKTFSGKKMVSF